MGNPVYISRGGEQVFEPPYVAEGVQFFGFIVKADNSCLQAICNRYLNGPIGRQDFSPLVPFAMFVFNKIERMYAKSPPDNNRGWYTEQEGAVWMLVWDSKRGKPLWYHPYMVVDGSYAMAMGREIYGFPKEIGWFKVPDGPRVPNTLRVDTVVVKTLTPKSQAKPGLLFAASISKVAAGNPPYMELKDLDALTEALTQRLVLSQYASGDLLKTLSLPMPMIFLKQFRDSVDPRRACFQSIQEVQAQMTRLLSPPRIYLLRYELIFDDAQSHPIRTDLGLVKGAVPVEVAFWAKFNFEIGTCTEISRS